jgi:CRISPR-associated endonuclease/helicase Cas3
MRDLVKASRGWFPLAFEPGGKPLPSAPEFQHLFAGIVMLADWLGSDTRFFPYSVDNRDRMPFARSQASTALQAIGLDCSAARGALANTPMSYQHSFGFRAPRDIQARAASLDIGQGPSLAILEAETGSGKTEAAYWHYLRLFRAGQVDGMYFALPTRTAATQLYRRLVEATRKSFTDSESRPPVVLAVPGYLSVDDVHGQMLPGFQVLWSDDKDDRMRHRGWAAEGPKRYLAGSIVVGTIDQVLMSTLAVSHAHLRASALSRLLLVVDEVHASDAYMTALLESVVDTHFASRGHAFLMSATLGQSVAHRFAKRLSPELPVPTLEAALAAPFPAVSWQQAGTCTTATANAPGLPKKIALREASIAGVPHEIAQLALDAANKGASVLVIRNTVKDCRATQAALEELGGESLFRCKGRLTAHHSRYAKEDRLALDEAIELAFGLGRSQSGRIAVATQTIQQSLDLDADFMISDLCPLDVLLQRLGRLHRHVRPRPQGYERPGCLVLVPDERDLCLSIGTTGEARGEFGLGSVYQDLRILEATWRLITERPIWCVPEENRELVERATHPEALAVITRELGPAMESHAHWLAAQLASCRRIADGHLVRRDVAFGHEDSCFPHREQSGRITTRLGADDRLAVFSTPIQGAFGQPVRQLTIPTYWLRGSVSADEEPVVLEQGPHATRFSFGGQTFSYDRLGLHKEELR